MSKNQLLEMLDGIIGDLNKRFPFGPGRERFESAIQEIKTMREEIDEQKRPTLQEGTWKRLLKAVNVPEDPDDFNMQEFRDATYKLKYLDPNQVR